jgi:GGDEF domain-containing protein
LRAARDLSALAQRLIGAFEQPFVDREARLRLVLNMGIAIHPFDGVDAATLVRQAKRASIVASRGGRNTWCICAAGQRALHSDGASVK